MSTRKHLNEQNQRRSQRTRIYIGVAAVVAIAAVAAVVLSQSDSPPAVTTDQVRPVTTTGSPLPAYVLGAPDPAVGTAIPTVSGTSFAGQPVSIADNGKPKVVLFVAHWCPHCQREVPLLADELRKSPLPANVEMITVSTGVNASAPNYPPSEWLADVKWPTPVIVDDEQSSAAAAFGISGYPYFVFVDADGNVAARSSGEMSVEDFRAHVAAIQK